MPNRSLRCVGRLQARAVFALAGLLAAGVLSPGAALAAQIAPVSFSKGPIGQDVYDTWRSIAGTTLSRDGRWVAYTLTPVDGEGDLVIRQTDGPAEFRVPRGYTGRPNQTPSGRGGFSIAPPRITGSGGHVLALLYPSRETIEASRRDRRRRADAQRTNLAIVTLPGGGVVTIPRVKSFSVARDGGRYAVYQFEADSAGGDSTRSGNAEGGARGAGRDSAARGRNARAEKGAPMVLRALADGAETRVEDVVSYALSDDERWLAYVVGEADSTRAGVYLRDLASGAVTTLRAGRARYRDLTFDREATQLAFLEAPPADTGAAERATSYTIWRAPLVTRRNAPIAASAIVAKAALDDSLIIPERAGLRFVRDGSALVFGVGPVPADSIPRDSLADKAVYDLWHWQDPQLQPTQAVRAGRERNRTYASVWHARTGRVVRLASDSVPTVTLSDDGRVGMAASGERYAIESMWGEGGDDIYVFDATTGTSVRVAERVRGSASLSPGARFVTWFDQGQWYAYEVATRTTRNLTGGITGVAFAQETWSTPSEPAPWGLGGWTPNDESVLINDRYDVWVVDPRGARAPRRLTGGVGRARQHTFRVVQLDDEARFVEPSQPVLLEAFDDVSKQSGWWRGSFTDSVPTTVLMAPKRWGELRKAEEAERFVVTRADYREYPDLWSGPSLTALTRISDAMPEQSQLSWGDVQLVSWLDTDGDSLAGLLYTPEGFDPSRQYPLMVYFYETHSDGLHNYVRPAGRNIVNPVVYTSQGYLVFMPDIKYRDGFPGPSALRSVVPGVQSLIARGFVKKDGIGVTGQSWGGYQTAYLVTQTNLFSAAVPNATVSNMTSAYGGIRWGTGIARSFQYEKGQSRIGGSLWEYPERYIENSPLFFADRIETPLLFMANDNDGAVPWWQGIEFFVALRRLGKEAYMVNYNGDEHNPTKYANQKDIDRKMLEFFGHHLKGDPAPSWMTRGIPFVEKGRDQLAQPLVP